MRILIAEDEPENLEEIERILYSSGIFVEVDGYINPLEALAAVERNPYDLALLDIMMPVINGMELGEKCVALQPNMSLVYITAYNNYATEAFGLHALDYILKPIHPERLLTVLTKVRTQERRKVSPDELSKTVRIVSFSGLRMFSDFGEIHWDRPKAAELFGYLLLNKEERVHKETLCEEIWPNLDIDRSLANLQVTVCRLRKTMGVFTRKKIGIEFCNGYYTLHVSDTEYDRDTFDKLIQSEEEESLLAAFLLYKGNVFEQDGWLWAENLRVAYEKKYVLLVRKLAELYNNKGEYHRAEAIMSEFVMKTEPDDEISRLFLTVSEKISGAIGLKRTGKILEARYNEMLGMSLPKDVKKTYERLLE